MSGSLRESFRLLVCVLFAGLLASTAALAASTSRNLTIQVEGTSLPPGFYVATNGSDSNPGTLASPFATLTECQTAMQGSSTTTCYIRTGICSVTSGLTFSSRDNGETWMGYPPAAPK